jgi:hypothetical protein
MGGVRVRAHDGTASRHGSDTALEDEMSDNSLREENAQLREVLTDMLRDMRHSPHPEILEGLERIVAIHKTRKDAHSKGEARRLGTIIRAMRLVMPPTD